MTGVVLLNHAVVSDAIASVHRADCWDLPRDQAAHASELYGPFANAPDAIDDYLDAETLDLGYSAADVRVHICCAVGGLHLRPHKEDAT